MHVKKKQYLCSDFAKIRSITKMSLKKLILFLLCVPMLASAERKIMLISDPHVMAQSLSEDGGAFDYMMQKQRKMLHLSEAAFVATIDTALLHKPALVLIPGDLTKDSEIASHDVVLAQLKRLEEAGIAVLLIPGNHDIDGDANAYIGEGVQTVDALSDSEWEHKYDIVYSQVSAKDPLSHSYVAEPILGVSVLGIDASHGSGDGYLSEETLEWVLNQADLACDKGNMVLAMCHWQLLKHVDNDGIIMESGSLQDADIVRDSLMAHDVRLVLTGHMHINSISTYRDTLAMTGDSIVEISTGSPITYPCPYRWLTISDDRSSISVETVNLTTLSNHSDLNQYSREWMQEHAKVMIPATSGRLFDHVGLVLEEYVSNTFGAQSGMILSLLKKSLPQTDEEEIALVEKHLENTIIDLYLLHSDANEPTRAEADSLAQAMYAGISNMIHELTDATFMMFASIQQVLIDIIIDAAQESIQSLVEDRTDWTSQYYSDCTDDLTLVLTISEPAIETAVSHTLLPNDNQIYDVLGRRISAEQTTSGQVYIQNGKKIKF